MPSIGGLEYTETLNTTMAHRPGTANPVDQNGQAVAPVVPIHSATHGGVTIDFYRVPAAAADGLLGAVDNQDRQVFGYAHVAFTNDVRSAEWKIESHVLEGKTPPEMMTNVAQDLKLMFALRADLAADVLAHQAVGQSLFITPGPTGNSANIGAAGLFEYKPSAQAEGKAQITVQYQNKDTIRRICLLNASKYLTGTKVAEGEDVAHVTGSPGMVSGFLGLVGTTSFATAEALLKTLTATAAPVADGTGATALTQDDVGLIKLMIVNEAMATTMTRYNRARGEAQEKNIQRFFPKSERQFYPCALAGRDIGNQALANLRAHLSGPGIATAMAQAAWASADPFALRVDETLASLGEDAAQTIRAAKLASSQGQKVSPGAPEFVKNQVLGTDAALLRTWIQRATLAYTDQTGNRGSHFTNGIGNVVSADRFTPIMTLLNGTVIYGAVYEFREREVRLTSDDYTEALAVMEALLAAS